MPIRSYWWWGTAVRRIRWMKRLGFVFTRPCNALRGLVGTRMVSSFHSLVHYSWMKLFSYTFLRWQVDRERQVKNSVSCSLAFSKGAMHTQALRLRPTTPTWMHEIQSCGHETVSALGMWRGWWMDRLGRSIDVAACTTVIFHHASVSNQFVPHDPFS